MSDALLEWSLRSAMVLLSVAASLTVLRLVRGPDLPHRVVALDTLAMIGVGMVGLHTLQSGEILYLLIAMVVALITFLGTIAFASYVAGRRPR